MSPPSYSRALPTLWVVMATIGCSGLAPGGVVPGSMAPATGAAGDSRGALGADESGAASDQGSYADALFLQNMIPHHAQALDMSALAPGRAGDSRVEVMARRIEAAQRDEIARMARLLETHGVPPATEARAASARPSDHGAPPGGHVGHTDIPGTVHDPTGGGSDSATMRGMITPDEMQGLAELSGNAFDRRFLELMIRHHQGAVEMVAELFASPGAAQNPEVFEIASEIDGGQRVEIARMQQVLATIR